MSREFLLFRRILANDLRLFLRSGRGAAARFGGAVLTIPILGFMHLPAFFAMRTLAHSGHPGGGAEFGVLLVASLLLAAAFQRSLETLYNRGDLPFLLSSPAPLRVIVATRLVDIALTTFVGTALFVIPVIDCAALLFGLRWLWGYAAWLAGVALLVPLALAGTIALVRRIGARRARVLVQLFGIVLGMGTFIGFQASNMMTRPQQAGGPLLGSSWLHWFTQPPLTQLAAAVQGDWRWLGALALLGVVATYWALRHLQRAFALGAIAAGADATETPRAAKTVGADVWRGRFETSRWRTLVTKELRLVLRDPLLLARASTQIITIVPALASAFLYRASVGLAGVALVGPAMAAALLAALMTTNDEAPVCVAVSPITRRSAIAARAAAAAFYPAVLGWVIALVVLSMGHPFVAAVSAAGATLNAAAVAWLTSCTVRLHTAEERARNKQPMILAQTFYGMFVGGFGAGGVAAWVAGHPIAAVVLLIVGALGAAAGFIAQPRRTWKIE
ncbi:MAG TPA: hypothetical protein VK163_15360 [Opitutaceae bacterium]|nr:hypothetical protein [Opitutaceae bacterium]